MATEKLKFKLELWAEYWDQPPQVRIAINDHTHFKGKISALEKEPQLIEFEHELIEEDKYQLIIERTGKTSNQTVVDHTGSILKDQLLHIKSVEIDEIDIGALVYEANYKPLYPEPWASQQKRAGKVLPESFKNVTVMGHNGRWELSFQSPFYMWLLENLY